MLAIYATGAWLAVCLLAIGAVDVAMWLGVL